jgi:ring-1,2-phenylacetyl-CoA epoxidase subunit PaaE
MVAEFHPLAVSDVRRETPEAVSIAFKVPQELAQAYHFHPGQHLTLRTTLGGMECRRSYSICSGVDDGELRVAVKKTEGGVFSRYANEGIVPGDSLDVMTPQGRFGIAPDPEAAGSYLAIAAGSGITPVMSILRSVLARQKQSRFVLVYGNRTALSIIFKEALDDLKDRYLDRLVVHHVLSREHQDVELLNGRIDAQKIEAVLSTIGSASNVDHVFLCGPYGLIEESRAALVRLGVTPERIHVEYFTVDGMPVTPPLLRRAEPAVTQKRVATAHIRLYGSAYDIPIFEGETIVEAGLRLGLEMPYSCRGGMCCTCRAKLLSGEVKMDRNYSLEPWEMAAGYVLTCQSHPLTSELALDYDQV